MESVRQLLVELTQTTNFCGDIIWRFEPLTLLPYYFLSDIICIYMYVCVCMHVVTAEI